MEKIHKEKFSNQVCRYISDKIIFGEYKDGERLVETKIAKELGVSQSPVREALRELEVSGLVEIKPYSGCFVRGINEKKLQQIYSLRSLLECFAAEAGIPDISDSSVKKMEDILTKMELNAIRGNKENLAKYDVQFHRVIVESAENPMLERMWKLVGAQQWTTITINAHDDILFFPESHRPLLEYARKHDTVRFVAALEKHFQTAADTVVKSFFSKK